MNTVALENMPRNQLNTPTHGGLQGTISDLGHSELSSHHIVED